MNKMVERRERADLDETLSKMDVPALRAELAKALKVTAETLSYLAAIWRELEARGEDLSDLRNGVGQHLAMIATGQLASEVVIRFAGRPSLLRAIQTLPLAEQRAMAQGAPLKIATLTKDNKIVSKDISAASLTSEQIRIAFDHGRVRSLSEQENMIESARVAARRRSRPGRAYKVKVDAAQGTAMVGRMTIAIADMLDALQLAGVLDVAAHKAARNRLKSCKPPTPDRGKDAIR